MKRNKKIEIKPAEGRALRDHTNGFKLLPDDEWTSVFKDTVWLKRIADGDAILKSEEKKDSTLSLPGKDKSSNGKKDVK